MTAYKVLYQWLDTLMPSFPEAPYPSLRLLDPRQRFFALSPPAAENTHAPDGRPWSIPFKNQNLTKNSENSQPPLHWEHPPSPVDI